MFLNSNAGTKRQTDHVHNARRAIHTALILDALYDYSSEHNGFPQTLPLVPTEICRTTAASCDGLVDLSFLLDADRHLNSIPVDPDAPLPNGTGYFVSQTETGKLSVTAPYAESGAIVGVTW